MIIGVLSDTHGTIHPRLIPLFRALPVELILHAGDVGDARVLRELEALAPVMAVRGNVDVSGEVSELPIEIDVTLEGKRIYMTHIGYPPRVWAGRMPVPLPDVVICGHTHVPLVESMGRTLFLNPGSAGTRSRFGGGLSAAILRIAGGEVEAEIITLQEGSRG